MKLLMLKGLPASGKSTFALNLVRDGWTRVNKDDIRATLHNGKWTKGNENQVLSVRDAIISDALGRGRNVVVDDTNFAPKHSDRLAQIAKEHGAYFHTKSFNTDVDTCIERDLNRERSVGENVIRKMWRQYIEPPAEYASNGKPKAVIFDLDGTLAKMGNRSPYDWARVKEDKPNWNVAELLETFKKDGYKILLFTGRDGVCEGDTKQWLEKYSIDYDAFDIRPENNNEKDDVIKRRMYDKYKDQFDIKYVVDDRLQVARMWHTLGLTLLKVGDPDLEF